MAKSPDRNPTPPRPRAPWVNIVGASLTTSAIGFGIIRALVPERYMLNWVTYGWLTICAVGISVCLFLSLRDKRRDKAGRAAEAERAAKAEAAEAERAAKAEAAETERAAKAGAAEAERTFKRSTTPCVKCGERLPKWFVSRFKELGGNICLRCETGGFEPYPEPGQTEDDYAAKRRERHAALPSPVPPKKDGEP